MDKKKSLVPLVESSRWIGQRQTWQRRSIGDCQKRRVDGQGIGICSGCREIDAKIQIRLYDRSLELRERRGTSVNTTWLSHTGTDRAIVYISILISAVSEFSTFQPPLCDIMSPDRGGRHMFVHQTVVD